MKNKILLIDDDKLVGITLQKLLKLRGYNTSFVDNGAAAIQKIKETSFDLIISDIKMARLDGIETIRRIREYLKEQSKESIPELLITGYAESESYRKIKELQPSEFIYKPFDNDKFLQTVEQLLAVPTFPSQKRAEPFVKEALPDIEKFFASTLPQHIKEICKNNYVLEEFNQKQIMELIDFTPPFLRIEKMAVVGRDTNDILQNISLATGILTINDVKGHYNDTIFLAMYGLLMASAASIYLAILFPSTAPQVVEVDNIKPSRDRVLWRPAVNGSRFFVETHVVKKKLQMVVVDTRLLSSEVFMGEVSRLKLVLTPKNSIWEAKKLPEHSIGLYEKYSDIAKETVKRTSIEESEEFFTSVLPTHVKSNYLDKQIYRKLNQQDIMKTLDIAPPFLAIDKIIVFDVNKDNMLQSSGLAMGKLLPQDVAGHYNDTVFLAKCGLLMSAAASLHLAILFPTAAPEVIEAKGVKPIEKEMWKPTEKGATFWVETSIIRKKLQVVMLRARISFDPMPYGMVDELKLFLIPKQLIWRAPQLP